jgi:hypothetical protein
VVAEDDEGSVKGTPVKESLQESLRESLVNEEPVPDKVKDDLIRCIKRNEAVMPREIEEWTGDRVIRLNEQVVYHVGTTASKNKVVTSLRIEQKETAEKTLSGLLKVRLLGGYGFHKVGVDKVLMVRANKLKAMLTTDTLAFKQSTFLSVGGRYLRLSNIEQYCVTPLIPRHEMVKVLDEKTVSKREMYNGAKANWSHVSSDKHDKKQIKLLHSLIVPYFKYDGIGAYMRHAMEDIITHMESIFFEMSYKEDGVKLDFDEMLRDIAEERIKGARHKKYVTRKRAIGSSLGPDAVSAMQRIPSEKLAKVSW